MTQAEEVLWQRIAPLIGGAARFQPPRVRDIAPHPAAAEAEVRRVTQLAGRSGLVQEVAQDRFLLSASMTEIAEVIGALVETAQEFLLAQLRARLATGRKAPKHTGILRPPASRRTTGD